MPSERTSWTRARKLPGESSSAGMAVPPFVDRSVQVSGMCSRRPSGSSTNAQGPSSLATLRIRRTIRPTRGWCEATIRTQSVWPSERAASRCRLFGAGEGPVPAPDGHPAQRALGGVVAQADAPVPEEAGEGGPVVQGVGDRPADLRLGRHARVLDAQPRLELGHQGPGPLLPDSQGLRGGLAADVALDREHPHENFLLALATQALESVFRPGMGQRPRVASHREFPPTSRRLAKEQEQTPAIDAQILLLYPGQKQQSQ